MKTSLKDWPKVYQKIKRMRGMSVEEKIQLARSFAATPDERWEMNENCIKLLGLSGPVRSLKELERRKAKLRRLNGPRLWRLQVSTEECVRGRIWGTDLKLLRDANRKS